MGWKSLCPGDSQVFDGAEEGEEVAGVVTVPFGGTFLEISNMSRSKRPLSSGKELF